MQTDKLNKDAIMANFKLIRNLTGLSMTDFGQKLGVSKDQVASYENGRALPNEGVIHRVCSLSGLSRYDLCFEHISKEGVIKEMFTVLNRNMEASNAETATVSELKSVINSMQMTINAQVKMIEMQQELLNEFRKLRQTIS